MKIWMKPVGSLLIAGSLLAGGTLIGGAFDTATPAYAESDMQKNVVSVVGSGEISVKPDIAYLSIGIVTEANTAKEAQSANATKVAALTKLLKDTWGISDKDIQTDQFYVQPNYTYSDKEGQKIKGYSAGHTLNVAYRDLAKVGQLLDAASAAGANRIDNIRFSAEHPEKYQEQVIQKAMADANSKATAITKAANRQLGIVLSISQSDISTPVYMQNYKMEVARASDSAAGSSVEPGEINVRTTLSVMYEMK